MLSTHHIIPASATSEEQKFVSGHEVPVVPDPPLAPEETSRGVKP